MLMLMNILVLWYWGGGWLPCMFVSIAVLLFTVSHCYCRYFHMSWKAHMIHVYLSDIYPRSKLRIYWCYFSLCSQHVSAPLGHPQAKHNLLLMYLEKATDITTDPFFTICLLLSITYYLSLAFFKLKALDFNVVAWTAEQGNFKQFHPSHLCFRICKLETTEGLLVGTYFHLFITVWVICSFTMQMLAVRRAQHPVTLDGLIQSPVHCLLTPSTLAAA
jgi:hypothetical protein